MVTFDPMNFTLKSISMKYFRLCLLLLFVVVARSTYQTTSEVKKELIETKTLSIELPSGKTLSDEEKILANLDTMGFKDKDCNIYWGEIDNCFKWFSWEIRVMKKWNTGEIIISNNNLMTWTIYHKVFVTWWYLVYDSWFMIKTPKWLLWWWIIYNTEKNLLENIFMHPNDYDEPLAPKWLTIAIKNTVSWSWTDCNPYNLEYFDMEYWKAMEKKGHFFVSKKVINSINITSSYQKKYYSDDPSGHPSLFNGWLGIYCFLHNSREYKVSSAFMTKKEVDTLLNSFTFL